jgi:hypothetical protein
MHQNLYLASTLDRYPCESKIYHASLLVFSIHIRQVHLWKQNASYFTNCTGIVLSTLDRYLCGYIIWFYSNLYFCQTHIWSSLLFIYLYQVLHIWKTIFCFLQILVMRIGNIFKIDDRYINIDRWSIIGDNYLLNVFTDYN